MRLTFKIVAVLHLLSFLFAPLWGQKNEMIIKALQQCNEETQLRKIVEIAKKVPVFENILPFANPIDEEYFITSNYGYRTDPITGERKFHSGIDYSAEYASKIIATADGVITYAGIKRGYGKTVIIEHKHGFKTIYAHMTLFYANRGNKVKKGDVIGFLGSTGRSTGNHLHYEIRKDNKTINPEIFLQL